MSALGLPPCPAAPSDSVNLATAALTLAVGGRLGAYMSPSWDSLQHLPLTLSWLDKQTTLKQSHVALRRREGTLQISSVDSACLADRSLGFPAAATAKRHIPVKLSPPPWIPWILILVAAIQGHPGRRFFFSHPLELFGLKHLSTSAVLLSGAILLSLVFSLSPLMLFSDIFPRDQRILQ